jgi:hypothetical protein
MGTILVASCSCGFASGDFFAGGGMLNFTTYCGAPALCEACGAFSILNYLDANPSCSQCSGSVRFYNDPALQTPLDPAAPARREIFSWQAGGEYGVFQLPHTPYRCPQCHELRMTFTEVGMWD